MQTTVFIIGSVIMMVITFGFYHFKKKKNEYDDSVIFFICLFIGVVFAILVNMLLLGNEPIECMNDERLNAWVGYAGSILGGAFTIWGVSLTLNQENENRKKDLAIEYKPILTISHNSANTLPSHSRSISFELYNAGRGEAINIKIANESSQKLVKFKSEPINFLKKDDSLYLNIPIVSFTSDIDLVAKLGDIELTADLIDDVSIKDNVDIIFSDMFGNELKGILNFIITFHIHERQYVANFSSIKLIDIDYIYSDKTKRRSEN